MKKIIILSFLIINVVTSNGQWNGTTLVGNPVCTTSITTAKNGNVSSSDGAGGMFVAWIDSRISANQSIYVQRILSNGSLAFVSEVLVANAITGIANSGNKSNLTIEPDGVGGAILVWLDQRNYTAVSPFNNDVYGQRIDATGAALWTAGGKRMTVSDNSLYTKITPRVTVINATEAIVIFGDNRLGTSDLFAQKITLSTGNTAWVADVSVHGSQLNTSTNIAQVADGSDGLFLTWQDARPGSAVADIYAQRIDNSGTMLWGANATAVCTNAALQSFPSISLDGAGGVIIAWTDSRGGVGDGDIYAQRMNAAGAEQWAMNGIAVCIQSGSNQTNPFIVQGGGGFIIVWSDQRAGTGQRNIYANSIDASGTPTWTTAAVGGIAVCIATGNQPSSSVSSGIQLVSDGSNGAIIVWDDARVTTNIDIYAQRINSAGVAQWTTDGVLISNAAGNQITPSIVTDNAFKTIIAWRDARNGTANGEIYASKLLLTGLLPLNILQIDASIQNNISTIYWKTDNEINAQNYIVQRSDNGSVFYDVVLTNAKGINNSSYSLKDNKLVKTTALYRIKIIDKNGEINYSAIVKVKADNKDLWVSVFPNPTNNVVKIEMNNIKLGYYNLKIIDNKGAIVKTQSIKINGNNTLLSLDVQNIVAGHYVVQIIGEGINESKMIIIKSP
jgi:hypothetical protein